MPDIGIASLTDVHPRTIDGRSVTVPQRMEQITELAGLADQLGLHHFAVGEHHSAEFAVSSPALVLAAIAARTRKIRLTSSVTTLGVHDPIRVYQDFATLDVLSSGRAEITVGRGAFREPFALFGVDLADYDAIFEEKLDLLLRARESETIDWHGRFRSPIDHGAITPRSVQPRLPVWLGVGGTPASAVRAGRLGLPMILGYIGGPLDRLVTMAELYRSAGQRAGHEAHLQVGVALHYFGTAGEAEAAGSYPYYREFLRPKKPGGSGFIVDRPAFDQGREAGGHLMIGTVHQVIDKLGQLIESLAPDRIQALVDWGGLPVNAVTDSVQRLATEIIPALPAASPTTVALV